MTLILLIVFTFALTIAGSYLEDVRWNRQKVSGIFEENENAHEIDDLWGWDNNGNRLWNR